MVNAKAYSKDDLYEKTTNCMLLLLTVYLKVLVLCDTNTFIAWKMYHITFYTGKIDII